MKICERQLARLEVYDKLAASQLEAESGERLQTLDEVFSKYRAKYVMPASYAAVTPRGNC